MDVGWAEKQIRFNYRHEKLIKTRCELPAGLEEWEHINVHMDEEVFLEELAHDTLNERALDILPDTLSWRPLRIVSAQLKDLLHSLAPDSSQFFPFSYKDYQSGEITNSDYWFWLPVHRLDFERSKSRPKESRLSEFCWGAFDSQYVSWDFQKNEALKSHDSKLPFFGESTRFSPVVFRADIYHEIKSLGVTGFEEWDPSTSYVMRPKTNTVGYIY